MSKAVEIKLDPKIWRVETRFTREDNECRIAVIAYHKPYDSIKLRFEITTKSDKLNTYGITLTPVKSVRNDYEINMSLFVIALNYAVIKLENYKNEKIAKYADKQKLKKTIQELFELCPPKMWEKYENVYDKIKTELKTLEIELQEMSGEELMPPDVYVPFPSFYNGDRGYHLINGKWTCKHRNADGIGSINIILGDAESLLMHLYAIQIALGLREKESIKSGVTVTMCD